MQGRFTAAIKFCCSLFLMLIIGKKQRTRKKSKHKLQKDENKKNKFVVYLKLIALRFPKFHKKVNDISVRKWGREWERYRDVYFIIFLLNTTKYRNWKRKKRGKLHNLLQRFFLILLLHLRFKFNRKEMHSFITTSLQVCFFSVKVVAARF